MAKTFDFSGWATKNDLLCADGRIIRRDAFKDNDGQTVPLVYQHQHSDPMNILGHAVLENREDGVYAYCSFNDTPTAQHVKAAVQHGDVASLSIYANKLVQKGKDVLHGVIREVSIVLAGANPGAFIDNPVIVHGEGTENESYEDDLTEGVIYADSDISLYHAEEEDEKKKKDDEGTVEVIEVEEEKVEVPAEAAEEKKEAEATEEKSEEESKMADKPETKEKTVQDVFDELTEEQKKVVYFMIGQALEDAKGGDDDKDEDEGEKEMKHNVFDNEAAYGPVLSHADQVEILTAAKKYGSLQQAIEAFCEENELQHDGLAPVSGFTSYPDGSTPAGVDALFPEYRNVNGGAPDLVAEDQTWVKTVLGKVHKTPFSRIRTNSVDVRNIEEIRARGYAKGKEKVLAGNYAAAKRATDPQTVYVKSALNRDDIIDITDFDYVAYQYKVDRMQLEMELARAILIGDGRDAASADKIFPDHIRPIWGDNSLYTISKTLELQQGTDFGTNYLYADAMETALLDAKIDYRGTGAADMFCDQAFFNKLVLAKDLQGHRLYKDKKELAAALDVNDIFTVPEFANKTRTVGEGSSARTYKLLAIVGNLADYALGATKGGEITHFTQFDIDFNQEKSLLETRVSGAATKVGGFIVIEEEVA